MHLSVQGCVTLRRQIEHHVVMNYDAQSGEGSSPSPLPRPSDPSAYRLNCAVDTGHLHATNVSYNMNYNLAKPIRIRQKCIFLLMF